MDGIPTLRTRSIVLPAIATLALFGAGGAGFAQQQGPASTHLATATAEAPVATAPAPTFVPSDEALFEQAFARFETPVEPALPAHAVDITEIEPAAPPPEPEATSLGRGVASYYGRRFHGRPTASGERFDMNQLTAAHRTLPFGSRVRVTNPRSGASVVVRINDRGPFTGGRTIDLSRAAAEQVGIVSAGHGTVELALLD